MDSGYLHSKQRNRHRIHSLVQKVHKEMFFGFLVVFVKNNNKLSVESRFLSVEHRV